MAVCRPGLAGSLILPCIAAIPCLGDKAPSDPFHF